MADDLNKSRQSYMENPKVKKLCKECVAVNPTPTTEGVFDTLEIHTTDTTLYLILAILVALLLRGKPKMKKGHVVDLYMQRYNDADVGQKKYCAPCSNNKLQQPRQLQLSNNNLIKRAWQPI